MKLPDGRTKKERLTHVNEEFKYYVQEQWDTKQWVDQHDVAEDRKTAEQAIQERVHHIKTDTQDTVISQMFDHITKLTRNVWLTHLRTLLDSNGHIRSGQVKEDVIEDLRLYYFLGSRKKMRVSNSAEQEGEAGRKSKALLPPRSPAPFSWFLLPAARLRPCLHPPARLLPWMKIVGSVKGAWRMKDALFLLTG
jgi:hypothetical protein